MKKPKKVCGFCKESGIPGETFVGFCEAMKEFHCRPCCGKLCDPGWRPLEALPEMARKRILKMGHAL
jgi:hypothetical protein